MTVSQVHRHSAKTAHGVHDIDFAVFFYDLAHFFDRIHQPRGGFTVYDRYMGNRCILFQRRFDLLQVRQRVLRPGAFYRGDLEYLRHFGDALAIGAIDDKHQLAVGRQGCADNGLYRISAAALHEHGLIPLVRDSGQNQ